LLDEDDLPPGQAVTIPLVCDIYDVLIAAEGDVTCELVDLDVCFDSVTWIIDDDDDELLDCAR
jgi:hypothetical protein